ncbi:hypothetical protein TSUD_136030 [Trifolium subterraneum]|uniref:Uncharacterized protein n=1 Tax=Trifolium subterraneum TaxID=3900 RepID=A0A2Z6PER5_TRISU|nr:hypothetical protein TSUD_136030 [Trifolium subterraneum]
MSSSNNNSSSSTRVPWIRYANAECFCLRLADIQISMTDHNPNRLPVLLGKIDEELSNLKMSCECELDDFRRQMIEEYNDMNKKLDENLSLAMKSYVDDLAAIKESLKNEDEFAAAIGKLEELVSEVKDDCNVEVVALKKNSTFVTLAVILLTLFILWGKLN